MTYLRKLWARLFCVEYMEYDIYDIRVRSCWLVYDKQCPGYKCEQGTKIAPIGDK